MEYYLAIKISEFAWIKLKQHKFKQTRQSFRMILYDVIYVKCVTCKSLFVMFIDI